MAIPTISRSGGEYRLLHFQPDPEDGDRVCVGILFDERGRFSILSNREMPKLRCVAPSFDIDLVDFYLRDLENALSESPTEKQITLRSYAPQIVVSEPRAISLPISDGTKLRLLDRFVGKNKTGTELPPSQQTAASADDQTGEHLKAYLRDVYAASAVNLIPRARPQDVNGINRPNINPVAFALLREPKVLLIDGVYLASMRPRKALSKTNVVHTFWQYGNLRDGSMIGRITDLQRIGIVLNGVASKNAAYADAHGYAFHQFSREAEIAVDATSGEGKEELRKALATATA